MLHYWGDTFDEGMPRYVWEPACGTGAMSEEMIAAGFTVHSTDLIDRGYGQGGIDFLAIPDQYRFPGAIITNPPFKHSEAFIRKAHKFEAPFIAMFSKIQFWNAKRRLALWHDHPPQACHPLSWRVDFSGQGNPPMDTMWIVWGDVPFSNEPLRKG